MPRRNILRPIVATDCFNKNGKSTESLQDLLLDQRQVIQNIVLNEIGVWRSIIITHGDMGWEKERDPLSIHLNILESAISSGNIATLQTYSSSPFPCKQLAQSYLDGLKKVIGNN